jgi:hypothetical protein
MDELKKKAELEDFIQKSENFTKAVLDEKARLVNELENVNFKLDLIFHYLLDGFDAATILNKMFPKGKIVAEKIKGYYSMTPEEREFTVETLLSA